MMTNHPMVFLFRKSVVWELVDYHGSNNVQPRSVWGLPHSPVGWPQDCDPYFRHVGILTLQALSCHAAGPGWAQKSINFTWFIMF